MTNLLYSTANQLLIFRTKYWVEINDDRREVYDVGNQIKSKKTFPMLWSRLCDYNDIYILKTSI